MATVIRFARHGTKKKPFFRIVVQDHKAPRDGRFIENIGTFNPVKGEATLSVVRPRLEYWLSVGAQMSESVENRLKPIVKSWSTEAPTAPQTPPAPKKESKPKKEAGA